LTQLGIEFEVLVPEATEIETGPARDVAVQNAQRKASAVDAEGPVLGVDTVVALGGDLYGKPGSLQEARATLTALGGRVHEVVSGLCLRSGAETRTACARTAVEFRALDEPLLDWYLASGEWRDRAGGYAIQGRGAALVARIEGDFFNVVGLPVTALLELAPELLRP
jgi:septum formation protein